MNSYVIRIFGELDSCRSGRSFGWYGERHASFETRATAKASELVRTKLDYCKMTPLLTAAESESDVRNYEGLL
jgi:hypothetical protein